MNNRRPRARYASDAEIDRAFELAKKHGVRPGGFTMGADGSVTILDRDAIAAKGANDGAGRPEDEIAAKFAKLG